MKRIQGRSVMLLLILAVCLTAGAIAGEAEKSKSEEKAAQEMAIFQVPKLMEGTLLRDLVKSLAAHPGIVLAQVDKEAGSFNVTFEPKKTNPDAILKALSGVAKEIRLEKVVAADGKAASHDCGKCPQAKSCPGAKAAPKK